MEIEIRMDAANLEVKLLGYPGGTITRFYQHVTAWIEGELTKYQTVRLKAYTEKIQTIKAVRELTKIGLKEAKELVESAPCVVARSLSADEAKRYKIELEATGATVEVIEA